MKLPKFYTVKLISFSLSIVIVSFASMEIAQAKNLNGAELKTALAAKNFSFTGKYNGTARYNSNGTVSYKLLDGYSDTEKWWIKSNKLCSKYKKVKKTKCYNWRSLGNGSYKTTSGYTFTPM